MSQVSPTMRRGTGRYFHWCPACEEMHPLPDGWKFNGSLDRPTFTPSFKQSFSKPIAGNGVAPGSVALLVCHYIITDGLIQFCSDSWHKRSDIVAMPPLPKAADPFLIETQD